MREAILLIVSAFLLALLPAQARKYTVKEVPMVHLQDGRRYVANPDGILSPASVAVMDSLLYRLEQQTGIQTLVAALEDIEGGDCFEFAYQLGEKNGVGEKRRNNGLVILLVTNERCVQFATGYGLEGVLPDAICKRIQERYMLDDFRRGDWSSGMAKGVEAACGYLDGSMERESAEDGNEERGLLIFVCSLVFMVFLLLGIVAYNANRCPKCKKRGLQRVGSQVISRNNGIKTELTTYQCRHCGYLFSKKKESDDEHYHNGGRGPFIGGFGGGSIGGGGFSGGSFGGGSFGGGGAGSRF